MKLCLMFSREEPGTAFRNDVWRRTFETGAALLGIESLTLHCKGDQFRFHEMRQSDWVDARIEPGDLAINLLAEDGDVVMDLATQYLESAGVRMVNSLRARADAGFRPTMLHHLALAGISMPKTMVVGTWKNLESAVECCGGFPIILKTVRGVKGVGVAICESMRGLRSVLQMLLAQHNAAILQEYIPGSASLDYKIIASCKEPLCGFRREARVAGEFRANVSLGGKADLVEVSPEMGELAVKAVKALNLIIGSVDIMNQSGTLRVIEVNDLPELNLSIPGHEIVEKEFAKYLVSHILEAATSYSGGLPTTGLFNPRRSPAPRHGEMLDLESTIIIP